ncbi:hypothetical protein Efla_005065 [Eimeria flavescens]
MQQRREAAVRGLSSSSLGYPTQQQRPQQHRLSRQLLLQQECRASIQQKQEQRTYSAASGPRIFGGRLFPCVCAAATMFAESVCGGLTRGRGVGAPCPLLLARGAFELPRQQQQQLFFQQQRQLRNRPTSGLPSFRASKGLKKLKKEEASPELQRLLLRREALPTSPPLDLEAERVPSAQTLADPDLPRHLLPPSQQQQQQPQGQQQQQLQKPLQREGPGVWSQVALHLGDISSLRACGVLAGVDRSLKIIGEGRGFTGSSSLFSAAGPWLDLFLRQQQQQRRQQQQEGDSSAAAAVSSFLSVARRLHADLLPRELQQKWPLDGGSSSSWPTAAAAAAAAAKARAFAASLNAASTEASAAAALAAAGEQQGPVPPDALLRPGSLVLSPGFGLPHSFLLLCVEPNAVLPQRLLLQQLLQLIECDMRQQGKQQQPQQQQEQRRLKAPRLHVLESCYHNGFNAAAALGLRSLAVPLLGVGAGGYPLHAAAYCATAAAHRWQQQQQHQRQQGEAPLKIVFCTSDEREWRSLHLNISRRMQLLP